MPNNGEIRTANGETRFWNGTGWQIVKHGQSQTPNDGPEADTFSGGFMRQLLEHEPAARNAMLSTAALAAPVVGLPATATVAATPFIGRGMDYLSKLLRGKNPLPETGTELLGDIASDSVESAASVYGGPALSKAAGLVRAGKDAVAARVPAWARGAAHLATGAGAFAHPGPMIADILTSKPVTTAVQDIGDQLTPEGVGNAFRSVAEGLTPGPQVPSMESLIPSHGERLADGARRYAAGRAQTAAAGRAGQGATAVDMSATAAEARAARAARFGGEGVDPNFASGAGEAELAGSVPYPRTSEPPSMNALKWGGDRHHGSSMLDDYFSSGTDVPVGAHGADGSLPSLSMDALMESAPATRDYRKLLEQFGGRAAQ